MKISVFSDSHGAVENMCSAIEFIAPDVIFHLGDYYRDAEALGEIYPDIPIYKVAGNCDGDCAGRRELTVQLGGKVFFLCHGHTYGVKSGLADLRGKARGADCALFGHTHKAWCEMSGETMILNPGTISGRDGLSCAVIQIEEGKLDHWFMNMEQGYWEEEK